MARSLEDVSKLYNAHCEKIRSVVLGTVDSQGCPLASYAPFVIDADKNIYVMVSGISPHTKNLESTGVASAMFIEDEHQSTEIFARHRLTFACSVSIIDSDDNRFDSIADDMYTRHGTIIERMRLLPDFRIVCLSPTSGRFVVGFGAAYIIHGDNLNELKHLDGGGKNPHGNPHAHPQQSARSTSSGRHAAMGHGHDESSSSRLPATPSGPLNDSMAKMIVKHMNDHHAEALINIAKIYGQMQTVDQALMLKIDIHGMGLAIQAGNTHTDIHIDFDTALTDARSVQSTLVSMSIEAKKRL